MYPVHKVVSGKSRVVFHVVTGVIAAAVLLAGCTNPFVGDNAAGATGALIVSGVNTGSAGGASAVSYTVFGAISLADVDTYDVHLKDGPGGAADQSRQGISATSTGFAESVAFEDLVPGDWTVEVVGNNSDGNAIIRGELVATVVRGEYTPVDVPVAPITGNGFGNLALTMTWPTQDEGDYQTTDVVTGFSYSIVALESQGADHDSGGVVLLDDVDTEDAYSFTEGGAVHTLSIGAENLPSGAWFVQVALTSDNASPYGTVARYDEVWYVSDNLSTTHTVALTEWDFSFGGGAGISVTLQTEEDLQQFFAGLDESGEEVASGSEFNIGAELVDSDGSPVTGASLTWRINSVAIAEELGTLDIVELSGGEETVVGRLSGVAVDESTLSFTPDHGVDGNGDLDESVDFPAGVSILVTLQVEHAGTLYSGSFRVKVTEPEA